MSICHIVNTVLNYSELSLVSCGSFGRRGEEWLYVCVCAEKLFDFKPGIPEPCGHRFRDLVRTLKFSASVGLYACPCFIFVTNFLIDLAYVPFKLECTRVSEKFKIFL